MNPCSQNRKPLAWLAAGVLDAAESARLREHVATCADCRQYLDSLSCVVTQLRPDVVLPQVEPSPSFHRELRNRIIAAKPPGIWENLLALMQAPSPVWRFALPLALLLVVMTSLLVFRQPASLETHPPFLKPPVVQKYSPPTLGDYRRIANRSLDDLDLELAREAQAALANPPPLSLARLTTAE